MKKIALIIDGISNSGGTDKVASILSNLFSENDYVVNLYSLKKGKPYYPINDKVIIKYQGEDNYFKKCREICKQLIKNKTEIVIVISMGKLSSIMIPILKASAFTGKIICSDHVSIETFSLAKRLLKYISYWLSDEVIVLTEHDRIYLNKIFGVKVKCIPNISSFNGFSCTEYTTRENIAVAIGRLSYQKNFNELIEIWHQSNINDWDLFIIGSGEEKLDLEKKITSLKLKNVKILPPIKNIEYWYNKASLLLMTSRYEGLPLVLIESKDFGVPALSLNCKTGPKEIIDNDGLLAENKEEFVKNLVNLTESKQLRCHFSQNAILNSRKYSKEMILKKWVKLFG